MNNVLSITDWVSVFKKGLQAKYPNVNGSAHTIESVQTQDKIFQIVFRSISCSSSVMAMVELDKNNKINFLKFYTVLLFNDLAAVKSLDQDRVVCFSS